MPPFIGRHSVMPEIRPGRAWHWVITDSNPATMISGRPDFPNSAAGPQCVACTSGSIPTFPVCCDMMTRRLDVQPARCVARQSTRCWQAGPSARGRDPSGRLATPRCSRLKAHGKANGQIGCDHLPEHRIPLLPADPAGGSVVMSASSSAPPRTVGRATQVFLGFLERCAEAPRDHSSPHGEECAQLPISAVHCPEVNVVGHGDQAPHVLRAAQGPAHPEFANALVSVVFAATVWPANTGSFYIGKLAIDLPPAP